jgi:hypothetical protein
MGGATDPSQLANHSGSLSSLLIAANDRAAPH